MPEVVKEEPMPDRLAMLETASRDLLRNEYARLFVRFGTIDRFYDCWAYHNATHGLDVAEAGVIGARIQVDRGRLPPEAVPLARIAGIFHDDLQTERVEVELSPRREELSVEAAFQAMDGYEQALGEHLFTADDRALVREMILATKVTGFHNGQIEQNTTLDSVAGQVMADADLSSLGYEGVRRALMLHVETEGRAGRLAVPYMSDGRSDISPDRARAADFMQGQAGLHRRQRFLVDVSERIWPQKADNARLFERLAHEYGSGAIDWVELIDRSGPATPEAGRGDHLAYSDLTRHFTGLARPGGPPVAGPVARPQLMAGPRDVQPRAMD
jgi:hypothetical protein